MRWFRHFNDARNNPKFRAIEKKLGEAGYARAFKLFEIVAERGGTGKDFRPVIDLRKPPTDLEWLADEWNISNEDATRTLEVFAEVRLVDQKSWRRKIVQVPQMLEYLDEWTERRRLGSHSGVTREHSPRTRAQRQSRSRAKAEVEQPHAPSEGGVGVSSLDGGVGFKEFWSVYPRKAGKRKAERPWKKIKAEEVPAILASIEVRKKTEQWSKEGGRFIPHPATFLNDRRWEDEVPPERKEGGADTCKGEGYSVPEAIYVQA